MTRSQMIGTLAALAMVLLVGCGSDPGDERALMGDPASSVAPPASASDESAAPVTPEDLSTVAPATGLRMSGDDYSFASPNGWVDITKQMRTAGQEIDTAVGEDVKYVTGVRENLNIVVSPASGLTLDAYEELAPKTLAFMVDDLETYERVTIAGEEAVHVGGEANTGEATFFFEQYVVIRDGTMYAMSFAVDGGRSVADRRSLVDPVLASWQWTA